MFRAPSVLCVCGKIIFVSERSQCVDLISNQDRKIKLKEKKKIIYKLTREKPRKEKKEYST